MAIDERSGSNALVGMTATLNRDLICPACGYEDQAGQWRVMTSGAKVVYRHDCPGCGAARTRVITLDE